ncbi:hypothetical protein ACOMHN_061707 [Nucella lapillus]
MGCLLSSLIAASTTPQHNNPYPHNNAHPTTAPPADDYNLQTLTTAAAPPRVEEPRVEEPRVVDPRVVDPRDVSRDDSRRHRRRNRRCKCIKRFMKEVDQLIDERLEDFENKYLRQANQDHERALALQNEASSTASRIQGLDKMMLALNTDVRQTKETLSLMSTNLEVLRYEMNHTRIDVRFLNESFRVLDGAVDSLNRFVKRVERMIPAGLTRPSLGAEVDDDPKKSYPRTSLCFPRL